MKRFPVKLTTGLTLVEFILAITLSALALVVALQFAWNVMGTGKIVTVSAELVQNARLATERITENVRAAEAVKGIADRPGASFTGVMTFRAVADTWIQQRSSANYGSDFQLHVYPRDSGYNQRSLVRFDLSSVPDDVSVVSAKLRLRQSATYGFSKFLSVHRINREWVEGNGAYRSGATWTTYDGVNLWSSSGGDFNPVETDRVRAEYDAAQFPVLTEWDVTADVRDFIDGATSNYGWLLKTHSEDNSQHYWYFLSREGAEAPTLAVDFGPSSAGGIDSLDDSPDEFAAGTHSGTEWNAATGFLELDDAGKAAGSGTFTSRVMGDGTPVVWSAFSWLAPYPYGLPVSPDDDASVFLFHMNETSGDLADSSGSGHHGIQRGTPPVYGIQGIFDQAISFDTNRFDIDSFDPPHQGTVAFWMRSASDTGRYRIMGGHDAFEFLLENGRLRNHFFAAGSSVLNGNRFLSVGAWYHVAATWDHASQDLQIYINGSLDAFSGTLGNDDPGGPFTFAIGASTGPGGTFREHFLGDLDEIAMWDRVLTPDEIRALHQRGAMDLRFQVRSCDDPLCDGDSFLGPDGTSDTYYQSQNSDPPSFSLSQLPLQPYVQYRAYPGTNYPDFTPQISRVALNQGSLFDSDAGILLLDFPDPDPDVTIDTYLKSVTAGTQTLMVRKLRMTESGRPPADLTSDRVTVERFRLTNLTRDFDPAHLTIELDLEPAGSHLSPLRDRTLKTETSVSLRH